MAPDCKLWLCKLGSDQATVVRTARGEIEHGAAAQCVSDLVDGLEARCCVGQHKEHCRIGGRLLHGLLGACCRLHTRIVVTRERGRLGRRAVPNAKPLTALAQPQGHRGAHLAQAEHDDFGGRH